jgi:predicted DNA-binding antitoxin AbrB/MazE fold protein
MLRVIPGKEHLMTTILAIYENGVFRPLAPVGLREGSRVSVDISALEPDQGLPERSPDEKTHIERVYEILSRRYDGGEKDVAARHNEHQP